MIRFYLRFYLTRFYLILYTDIYALILDLYRKTPALTCCIMLPIKHLYHSCINILPQLTSEKDVMVSFKHVIMSKDNQGLTQSSKPSFKCVQANVVVDNNKCCYWDVSLARLCWRVCLSSFSNIIPPNISCALCAITANKSGKRPKIK